VNFAKLKKCCHHFWLESFSNFWHFPTCFGCFLPADTTNQKSLNHRNFNKPFFAIFKVSRPETFETETCKNWSQDESRDQVLRLHHCYIYSDLIVRLLVRSWYRCQAKFLTCKMSEFMPCAYAHILIFCTSNTLRIVILRIKVWCLGKCVVVGLGCGLGL